MIGNAEMHFAIARFMEGLHNLLGEALREIDKGGKTLTKRQPFQIAPGRENQMAFAARE